MAQREGPRGRPTGMVGFTFVWAGQSFCRAYSNVALSSRVLIGASQSPWYVDDDHSNSIDLHLLDQQVHRRHAVVTPDIEHALFNSLRIVYADNRPFVVDAEENLAASTVGESDEFRRERIRVLNLTFKFGERVFTTGDSLK